MPYFEEHVSSARSRHWSWLMQRSWSWIWSNLHESGTINASASYSFTEKIRKLFYIMTENWYANFGLQLGSLTTNSSVLYHKIEKYQQMSIRQYWKIFTFFSLIDSMIAIRFLEAYVIWKYFVRVYADRDCAIMYYWPISAQCCISYRNQVAGFYIK